MTAGSRIPVRWPLSRPTAPCSSTCWVSAWIRTNDQDLRWTARILRAHERAGSPRSNAMKRDWLPLLLVPLLAAAALPLVGSPASWVTLTVAGLAMGLMIFVMASGLTLTFGLMDVLNFGHGAFIAVGAFVAAAGTPAVSPPLGPCVQAHSIWLNLAAFLPAILAAMAVSGLLGLLFERVIVQPV